MSIFPKRLLLVLVVLISSGESIFQRPIPDCAHPGFHVGAGLGALAGGVSGAAALSGLGSTTLAACPSMAVTTIAGSGGSLLGGPLVGLGGLVAGALLGGVAGGTTGGVLACRRRNNEPQEDGEEYITLHIMEEPQIEAYENEYDDEETESHSNALPQKRPHSIEYKPPPSISDLNEESHYYYQPPTPYHNRRPLPYSYEKSPPTTSKTVNENSQFANALVSNPSDVKKIPLFYPRNPQFRDLTGSYSTDYNGNPPIKDESPAWRHVDYNQYEDYSNIFNSEEKTEEYTSDEAASGEPSGFAASHPSNNPQILIKTPSTFSGFSPVLLEKIRTMMSTAVPPTIIRRSERRRDFYVGSNERQPFRPSIEVDKHKR